MRTFILDIIPKIKRFSQKLDKITVLTNKHWVVIDEVLNTKVVFIFREKDNQLLISNNGKIEKGNWEYLGYNSLLIDRPDGSYLFKHGFIDNSVLALKVDGKEEYALLVNEQEFDNKLNSVESVLAFLNLTYIEQKNKNVITIPEPNKSSEKLSQPIIKSSNIKQQESFSPEDTDLLKDLSFIKNKIQPFRKNFISDIVISYTRDKTIKSVWSQENPEVVDMFINKKLPIGTLVEQFDKSRHNYKFRKDLEKFIITVFGKNGDAILTSVDMDKIVGKKYKASQSAENTFNINDYPKVKQQINNCLQHVHGKEVKVFCELLIQHIKGYDIDKISNSIPHLNMIIKKPLLPIDEIHSLYIEKYSDKLFIESFEFYLFSRFNKS